MKKQYAVLGLGNFGVSVALSLQQLGFFFPAQRFRKNTVIADMQRKTEQIRQIFQPNNTPLAFILCKMRTVLCAQKML